MTSLTGLAAVLVLAAMACGTNAPQAAKKTLHLYCGAGLRAPVDEVVKEFGAKTGVVVEADYAGSEVLLSKVKLSQRGDLYMPGDAHYLELAAKEGITVSSRPVCYWVPVIMTPKGNPKGIQSLADLLKPGVKVALGDAKACAIGLHTVKLWEKNKIALSAVEPNVTYRATTVHELATHARLGSVDAAIVWDGVAAGYKGQCETVAILPEQNLISTVPIGTLKFAADPQAAQQFVEFITSEAGRAIFVKHGFTVTVEK
jgi:molybdate transport system substrate-binding protein